MKNSSINKQSVSAVKWSALGSIAQYGLSILAQIILARMLGPENYGLFAMGNIVLSFSNFLSNFGFAYSLIQLENLNDKDIRFVFTWQFISGTGVAIGLYYLAPYVAQYFNEPRVDPIVRWLSLACIFSALTAPGNNLLKRKLDFRWINIIQIVSYIIGYIGIGIPMAYYGSGVWALVAAWLSQAFVMLVMTFIRYPYNIKPLFWYEGARTISNVGLTVFVTNICNWLLNNMDRIFLGRYLNSHAVGLYTVGYNLANTPNNLLIGALQPAFLSAGARLQSEPERLRRIFIPVIASIWILISPLFVLFAISAPNLIGFLYGSTWSESATVLCILALSMPAYITWSMSTPILWNTERKHYESLLQMPIVALAAYAFITYAQQGILTAVLIASGTLLLRSFVITIAACSRLKITFWELLPLAMRGIFITSLTATATLGGIYLGTLVSHSITTKLKSLLLNITHHDVNLATTANYLIPFFTGCIAGLAILVATILLFPRLLGDDVIGMLSRFSPKFAKTNSSAVDTKT